MLYEYYLQFDIEEYDYFARYSKINKDEFEKDIFDDNENDYDYEDDDETEADY